MGRARHCEVPAAAITTEAEQVTPRDKEPETRGIQLSPSHTGVHIWREHADSSRHISTS